MKTIIITGASGQLGRSFISYLAQNNEYEILALDIGDELGLEISNVTYHKVDITSEKEVIAFFEGKEIYALINNAGIGTFTPFEERTVDEFMNVIDVNMKGTFLMCREAIKKMKIHGKGKIINIGSVYGVVSSDPRIYGESGRNNSEIYSMTKAAVIMLSKYLSAHYSDKGIQINTISPGGVLRTQTDEFVKNYCAKTPQRRMANPDDFHKTLDYLLDEENLYLNGQNIVVDGGFTAW
jgi:3-oxoacyl-[acyl-carrier protein] reductase